MKAQEWIAEFAQEIDLPELEESQVDEILRLAALAAHASERIAAPIACFLAGRSDKSLAELIKAAEGLVTRD